MANQQQNNTYAVDTWSNSIDYLQKVARQEDVFLYHSTHEDVDGMILALRNLYSLLRRMLKSRSDKAKEEADIYNENKKKYLLRRIQEAKKKYNRSQRSNYGSEAITRRNNRLYNEAMEELRSCYEDLGDFQLANQMTFKQGDDPNEAWALG